MKRDLFKKKKFQCDIFVCISFHISSYTYGALFCVCPVTGAWGIYTICEKWYVWKETYERDLFVWKLTFFVCILFQGPGVYVPSVKRCLYEERPLEEIYIFEMWTFRCMKRDLSKKKKRSTCFKSDVLCVHLVTGAWGICAICEEPFQKCESWQPFLDACPGETRKSEKSPIHMKRNPPKRPIHMKRDLQKRPMYVKRVLDMWEGYEKRHTKETYIQRGESKETCVDARPGETHTYDWYIWEFFFRTCERTPFTYVEEHMNIYDHIWTYLNIYEHIWIYMNTFEHIWIYMNMRERSAIYMMRNLQKSPVKIWNETYRMAMMHKMPYL